MRKTVTPRPPRPVPERISNLQVEKRGRRKVFKFVKKSGGERNALYLGANLRDMLKRIVILSSAKDRGPEEDTAEEERADRGGQGR